MSGSLKVHLVFSVLPPTQDGIGDYTAQLAQAMLPYCSSVKILTGPKAFHPIPGVEILSAFSTHPRKGIWSLLDAVSADPPDWLVVQYNPFSYGKWGLNLAFPEVIRSIRKHCPQTRIALMGHELYVRPSNWRFAVMTTWQRWQLWRMGQRCDLLFGSSEAWCQMLKDFFPETPVLHLPVGSNIPKIPASRRDVREELGVLPETCVVGLFGSLHPSRQISFVRAAMEQLLKENLPVLLLSIGSAGAAVKNVLGTIPVKDLGVLPASEVSRYFAAMDLYLAPFFEGVSTRRGSLTVALQHGVATVSTTGIHTDKLLQEAQGQAFLLVPDHDVDAFVEQVLMLAKDDGYRQRLGAQGQAFFEKHFSWDHIAQQMLEPMRTWDVATPAKSYYNSPEEAS